MSLVPAAKALVGLRVLFSDPLHILMFAVGIILLIACANIGGLMLARATARQKEVAVRLAVGADRRRIVRQLLTESLLLAVLGGGLGILFASWGASALGAFLSSSQPQPLGFTTHLDARVLGFTAAVSILTGLLFGVAPAFRSTRVDLTPALKEWADGSVRGPHIPHHRFSLGDGLVVMQVALAIVVLAGAGLMVHTLANLRSLNPGFDSRNVLLFGIDPTLGGYKGARVDNVYRALRDQLAHLPGVVSASYSGVALLSGGRVSTTRDYYPPGSSVKSKLDTDYLSVGPNFFETMRMPLLIGQGFSSADFAVAATANSSSAPVLTPTPVIVNQAFVRRYFSGVNPLGQHFGQSEAKPGERESPGFEIIGVVRDAKYDSLRGEISPTTYAPLSGMGTYFELRTVRNPQSLIPDVRNVVSRLDKNLPLFDIKTQSEQIDQILFRERLIARLSGFFGLLALLLACVGLYGLLSYEVARRTREIGIRMALGGHRADVLRLVVGEGLRLTLAGAIMGIVAALGLTRLLASFLFGVKPTDAATFAAVTALLSTIALIACYIPARRATKVNPIAALRYE
jgi:predicted permease